MGNRARRLRLGLSQNLGFVPGVIVAVFTAAGVGVVELDAGLDLSDSELVFQGDGDAARTVLSVIAGSLITVAGLTFSITMVVLQLASSQFSPRILRTFFGDRLTQVTIGFFVGTFAYAVLVLRAVGSAAEADFVPRLSVTVASLLGIAAVILLIVFLNHVARLVQVSHVAAALAHDTLARVDRLFPEPYGAPAQSPPARDQPGGAILPPRPGYVQRVELDRLADALAGTVGHVAVRVCPGDFAGVESPLAEVWPAAAADGCRDAVLGAITLGDERDLDQDAGFGLRQLTDIALKAMSPGINDPATAVTCIGYLRAILVRLTERASPPPVRELHGITLAVRRRGYDEHLACLLEVGRYVGGDAWVAGALLDALAACADAARRCAAPERLQALRSAAAAIAEQALAGAGSDHDRALIARARAAVGTAT